MCGGGDVYVCIMCLGIVGEGIDRKREKREIERDGEKLPERRVEGRRPRATNSASSRAPRPTFLPVLESENASFSIPSYMNSDLCVTLGMFPRVR